MSLTKKIGHQVRVRLFYWIGYLLYKSYRFRFFGIENLEAARKSHPRQSYSLACWHENALATVLGMTGVRHCFLISPSADGDYVDYLSRKLGFVSVRGSSSRGGKDARDGLTQSIEHGDPVCFTVDGPRGPRHQCKPGVVKVSRDSQVAILPVAAISESPWVLRKTWDQTRIPLPFSKIVFQFGPILNVPKDCEGELFDQQVAKVGSLLDFSESIAKENLTHWSLGRVRQFPKKQGESRVNQRLLKRVGIVAGVAVIFALIFGVVQYRKRLTQDVVFHTLQELQNTDLSLLSVSKSALESHLNHLPGLDLVMIVSPEEIQYYADAENFSGALRRAKDMVRFFDRVHKEVGLPSGVYFTSANDSVDGIPKLPVLAYASKKRLIGSQDVFLIPDFEAMGDYETMFVPIREAGKQHPWESKIAKVFWRGSTTGAFFRNDNWNDSARVRMINAAEGLDYFDGGFVAYPQFKYEADLAAFKLKYPEKNRVSPEDSLAYKYLIDVDGNSCSYSRMAWILASNSLLFKHRSDNSQWYYPKLKESFHYLAIAEDFHDLKSNFEWAEAHEDLVQKMIKNANELATDVFSFPTMARYVADTFAAYQLRLKAQQNLTTL